MSKYRNKRTEYDGRIFDSKKEAEFARLLDVCRKASDASDRVVDVQFQPVFPVLINGKKIFTYKADFTVTYADGRVEIIDVKGFKTPVYRLKKKAVEAYYKIKILEV